MPARSSVFHFDAIFSTQNEVSFFSATKNATAAQKGFAQAAALTNVETQKLEARLKSTEVRLNTLQQQNTRAANEATRLSATLAQQSEQYQRLGASIASMQAKAATGKLNPGLIAALEKQKDLYQKLGASIQANAAAEQRQQSTIAYTSAQIQVKSARIAELQALLSGPQAKKPTFFESIKNAIRETFSSWENFSNAAHKAVITYDRFTRGVQRTIKIANELSMAFRGKELFPTKGVDNASQKLAKATGSLTGFGRALDAVRHPVQTFNFLMMSAASFVGNLASSIVQQGIAAFVNFGRSAVGAVADFEKLNLSMKSLVARELQNADASLSFDDAMSKSSIRAQELLRWTERLAILSPFSVEDVKGTLQMAIAMGMTSDQAQRVTQDLLNWAAATGKGGAEIGRATYALSQMAAAGRLTGQDIMQLSQVGISVDQILSKSMGHTVAEIRAMREKGLIPVSEAIEAVLTDLEKFGNAAQKQSESLSGLLSSLGDLGTTTARNLFGPLITQTKKFGSTMNDELGGVQTTVETKVGGILGAIQPRLASLVSFLSSDLFQAGVQNLSRTLGDLADRAFTWGENLVNQFANGMLSAIGAILDALASIGNIIASWLMPGSPPKLLPELDKWGTGAMMAYMEGWTADTTGIFSDLSNTIGGYLKSLPKGLIDEVDFVPLMLKVRQELAKGLSTLGTGGASISEVVNNILGATGSAGSGLHGYLTSLFELQQANNQVTAAQEKLNDVTKKYDELLKPIEDTLNSLDEAQQQLRDKQITSNLELILKDPNATLAEKENARLEIEKIRAKQKGRLIEQERKQAIDAASIELEAAQAKQEAAQNEFARQKALLEIQEENNRLLGEQLALLDKLASGGGGGGGGAGGGAGGAGKPKPGVGVPFKGGVPELPVPQIPQALLDRIAEIQATLAGKFNAIKEAWTAAWDAIKKTLAPAAAAFEKVKVSASNLWTAIVTKLGPAIVELIGKSAGVFIAQLGVYLPPILENISILLDSLAKIITGVGESQATVNVPLAVFSALLRGLLATLVLVTGTLAAIAQALSGDVTGALNTLSATWGSIFGGVVNNTISFFQLIWKVITDSLSSVTAFVTPWLGMFKTAWDLWGNGLLTIWKTILFGILSAIVSALAAVAFTLLAFINLAIGNWEGFLDNIQIAWKAAWNVVTTYIRTIVTILKTIFSGAIENIKSFFLDTDWAALGKAIIDGIVTGLTTAASSLYRTISNIVNSVFNTAQNEAEARSPSKRSMRELGKPIGQGAVLGLLSMLPQAKEAAQLLMRSMIAPPMTPAQSASAAAYQTTYNRSVTFAPTYNTNAAPPIQDWGTLQALAA